MTEQFFNDFIEDYVKNIFEKDILQEAHNVNLLFEKNKIIYFIPELILVTYDFNIKEYNKLLFVLDIDVDKKIDVISELASNLNNSILNKNQIVVSAIFKSECWVKKIASNQVLSSRPISEYEDKKEKIIINASTVNNKQMCILLDIVRDTNNYITIKQIENLETNKENFKNNLMSHFWISYLDSF